MCAEGYPGSYHKGQVITGLDAAAACEDVMVFQAGTTIGPKGSITTNGGRVLGVTALADDLRRARDRANETCGIIHFDGAFHRSDIGERVLTPA